MDSKLWGREMKWCGQKRLKTNYQMHYTVHTRFTWRQEPQHTLRGQFPHFHNQPVKTHQIPNFEAVRCNDVRHKTVENYQMHYTVLTRFTWRQEPQHTLRDNLHIFTTNQLKLTGFLKWCAFNGQKQLKTNYQMHYTVHTRFTWRQEPQHTLRGQFSQPTMQLKHIRFQTLRPWDAMMCV